MIKSLLILALSLLASAANATPDILTFWDLTQPDLTADRLTFEEKQIRWESIGIENEPTFFNLVRTGDALKEFSPQELEAAAGERLLSGVAYFIEVNAHHVGLEHLTPTLLVVQSLVVAKGASGLSHLFSVFLDIKGKPTNFARHGTTTKIDICDRLLYLSKGTTKIQ
jgi:hypothetical protein